ncbi:hypothetical protein CIB48_g4804 [Xylaria polymorpha]|nr:hypothetical protein CIB48_g4804 [Xylaria polymorpha]
MRPVVAQRLGVLRRALQNQYRLHSTVGWRSSPNCMTQAQRLRVPTHALQLRQTRSFSDDNAVSAESAESGGESQLGTYSEADHEHAVISTFDLFSIGIGPSSSHTVGPMRAGNIFVADLREAGLLHKVHKIRIAIYGSLALTGEGHMTPSALLLGLESANVESVDTSYVPSRFAQIKKEKKLFLGRGLPEGTGKEIDFDYERDFKWEWGRKLPLHSNGMRFTVFDKEGTMLATNDLFSVGGGFVVNGALSKASNAPPATQQAAEISQSESKDLQVENSGGSPADLAENMFYKEIRRADAAGGRRTGSEIKPLESADESSALVDPQSMRPHVNSAALVYENEKSHGYTDEEIQEKLLRIWDVMDQSILEGVQAPLDTTLPGSLKLHRRAPGLYNRLTRGLYPSSQNLTGPDVRGQLSSAKSGEVGTVSAAEGLQPAEKAKSATMALTRKGTNGKRGPPRIHGSIYHPIMPSLPRRTALPALDYLTVYAIAVNETNAAGGRIVTAPTNGAAGIIPSVLKYTIEFISDDPERDILTFLLTAAAIGMLYKRGATISAAEGGCMAEVGVACSMAAGAFAACMGASPETIEQAAEIGIEHNLGLTCDPIGGLVQAPCIERNALGAIKAISSANLALSSHTGTQKVSLDDAIRAMRLTAQGMRNEFKETSLSGLATSVPLNIPVSVPDC